MGAFYFAITDEQGVLCVDQLDTCDGQAWTADLVAEKLAESYPGTIYFWYWAGDR